jgi:hypothetical protein
MKLFQNPASDAWCIMDGSGTVCRVPVGFGRSSDEAKRIAEHILAMLTDNPGPCALESAARALVQEMAK